MGPAGGAGVQRPGNITTAAETNAFHQLSLFPCCPKNSCLSAIPVHEKTDFFHRSAWNDARASGQHGSGKNARGTAQDGEAGRGCTKLSNRELLDRGDQVPEWGPDDNENRKDKKNKIKSVCMPHHCGEHKVTTDVLMFHWSRVPCYCHTVLCGTERAQRDTSIHLCY